MVDGTDVAEIIGNDWFFEITDPEELAYTYKIRPARDFGGIFVSNNATLLHTLLITYYVLIVEYHIVWNSTCYG
jgi:hypothetical protein